MKYELEFQKDVYLRENRYETPKHSFRFIADHARDYLQSLSNGTVLDVGTAAGEFPYFLRRTITPAPGVVGTDVIPELIEKATSRNPDCSFYVGSVLEDDRFPPGKFDAVFSIGVMSHFVFAEIDTYFANLIRWTRPAGRVYIFDKINEAPADTIAHWRHALSDVDKATYHFATVYSQDTIASLVERIRPGSVVRYHRFVMPADILPHTTRRDDFLRLWTIKIENGERIQINGLNIVQDQQLVEIALP